MVKATDKAKTIKLKDRANLLPIRRGLFDKKHYRKMGDAIWLFGFLVAIVDWKTWMGRTNYKTIEKRFEVHTATVWRWLKRLKEGGYLKYERSQYSFDFEIAKPKSQRAREELDAFVERFGASLRKDAKTDFAKMQRLNCKDAKTGR